jgi:glycosidase
MTSLPRIETSTTWHVYPLGFAGAPAAGGADAAPRLDALTAWLPYAADLGCGAVSLGPIFASETHGYDTLDHYRIDPRLGGEAEFDRLIDAAHQLGLRVVLDGVFNHLGAQHPWVTAARDGGPDGPEAGAFRWQEGRLAAFEGHGGLIELNHGSDRVAGFVADVMRHWLARGADGWRLDAAYRQGPGLWARVLPGLRADYPEAWFMGEVIHGDYPDFVARSTLDSVTQYELWKAIWSSLKDANFFELDAAMTRHNRYLAAFAPATFIGNHDVTRIATQVGPAKAALAAMVLLTLGGTPAVYYGDEQGFTGVKENRPGGDDAIRPAFPDSPAGLWEGGWPLHRLYRTLIGLRAERPWLARAAATREELTTTHIAYHLIDPANNRAALFVELDVADAAAPWGRVTDAHGALLAHTPT